MARGEGTYPDVPLKYRGIEVSEHVAFRWFNYYGTMWRMGIDNALDDIMGAVESECKNLEDTSAWYYHDDWAAGVDEGKECAADYIRDVLSTYNKE